MLKKSSVSLAVLLIGGQLYAQSTGSSSPAPSPPPTPTSTLTAAEMGRQATVLEGGIRGDLQHVEYLQALERKKQDVIKLSCVNDKFVKLKAEANLFDLTHNELTASLNTDGRFTVFAHLGEVADGAHKVRNEADQCAGELELGRESTAPMVTHPVIPDDPTGSLPLGGGSVVEPPGYASPYQ